MAALTLPDAAWRTRRGVQKIVDVLGGNDGMSRFVGGCVRDGLVGVAPNDVDVATQLTPDAVIARLEAAHIKAVPTGIEHGTITAVADGDVVEVTTLRRDVSTDGRRATIAYTSDWQEDAARRDFTINALSADPATGAVHDYFGGLADLEAQIVRFIGDPLTRIAEDHLRILRFFRFHARFGGATPDEASLAACAARANDLMALSRERIAMELLSILALPNPVAVVSLMVEQSIFRAVLPEIENVNSLTRLIDREQMQDSPPFNLRRLASLLPADVALAETVAARLKFSKAQRKHLALLAARNAQDSAEPQALAYRIGTEAAIDRLLLGDGDARPLRTWQPPVFPLTGGAIVARGIKAGPLIAQLLQAAERQWIEEGFPDVARANALLDALVADSR